MRAKTIIRSLCILPYWGRFSWQKVSGMDEECFSETPLTLASWRRTVTGSMLKMTLIVLAVGGKDALVGWDLETAGL
ncbi:hypothetical protein AXF42_Ash007174 [Apostasia shenzhenica]|uniref:Uncharacterized protein n=1 Tax=Apostasia shenzhenica TaxID=1088818 RepID=A0A2I0B9H6_9ASPA|nr:hypothetical protein AXF42_Ash007174 [Apostasia shenzhenica]